MVNMHSGTFWACGLKYESDYTYSIVVSVSADAGENWTRHELYSGTGYSYVRTITVDPNDSDRVFALGRQDSGYILYSTQDGGGTWNSMTPTGFSGTPYDIAVCPADGDRLAAVSYSGLYTSDDGGATWSRVTFDFDEANVLFESTLLSGLLIGTSDEGVWLWEDWAGMPVPVGSGLGYPDVSALCEGSSYLYAGTAGNAVWMSYNPTEIAGQYVIPLSELSLAVMPNPVIHSTASAIFKVNGQQQIKVAVYDLSGRLAMVAAEGIMDSGEHQINIDISGLSSGMYFVQLTAGDSSAAVRMVVAK